MFTTFRRKLAAIAACACTSALTLGAVAMTGDANTHNNGTRASKSGAEGGPLVGQVVVGPAGDQSPAVRDVFREALTAIGKKTVEVGTPIVEAAVSDGKITQAQADELKKGFEMLANGPPDKPGTPLGTSPSGEPPQGGPPHGPRAIGIQIGPGSEPNVREVMKSVMSAVAKEVPLVVKPIVDKAVSDGKITQAQADEISRALANFGHRPKLAQFCQSFDKASAAKKRSKR